MDKDQRIKIGYILDKAASMMQCGTTINPAEWVEAGYSTDKLDKVLRIFGWFLDFNPHNELSFASPLK